MASRKNITLCISGPSGDVQRTFEGDSLIVGSGAHAAVQIPDPTVSSVHLLLKVDPSGNVKAIDLGSEHGTRLGGNELLGPTAVKHGDVLVVGGSKVQVLFGEAMPVRPTLTNRASSVPAMQGPTASAPRSDVATAKVELPTSAAQPAARKPSRRALHRAAPQMLFGGLRREVPTEKDKVLQVAMLWGDSVLEVQHFDPGANVTVGDDRKNPFQLPGLGNAFTLAQANGLKQIVHIPDAAEAVVGSNGKVTRTEGRRVELGLGDRVQVAVAENLSFVVQYVKRPAHLPPGRTDRQRNVFLAVSALILIATGALIAALAAGGAESRLPDDVLSENKTAVKLILANQQKKSRVEQRQAKKSGAKEGDKAKGEEGKQGEKVAEAKEADPSKRGTPVVDPNKQKQIKRDKVMKSGLLGALGKGPLADTVLGPGGQGTGINEKLGGLRAGAGVNSVALGVGGRGSRGTGKGGGGNALGIGGLGTKGDGAGTGGSGIELGGKGKGGVEVIPGKTIIEGGLSKEAIARVVRQHEKEIKYCYEIELNKNPSLAGKVSMFWIIDGTGAVSEARPQESTLGSSSAERCMAQKIRRWKFPEPKGGGIVTVTYPWVFKPAAGEG